MDIVDEKLVPKPRLKPLQEWRKGMVFESPLYEPIQPALNWFALCEQWPDLNIYDRFLQEFGVQNIQGLPIHLVKNPAKRGRRRIAPMPYEQRIYELGELPTRTNNWHDFFNLMVWATFPATKSAINARQVLSPQEDPDKSKPRTFEQNALTRFDEGGCIVACSPNLFETFSKEFSGYNPTPDHNLLHHPDVRVIVFGHAIYDSLLVGRSDMGAQSLVLKVEELPQGYPSEFISKIDKMAAACLKQGWFRNHAPTWSIPISGLCDRRTSVP